MWIVLGVLFLTAVGLAMALPYLQKLSAESGDGHVFAQANKVRVFANSYKAKSGAYPATPELFKATAWPEGDLPNLEKEKFQVLLVSTSLAGDLTSLWILKSDAVKPLKLLEQPIR